MQEESLEKVLRNNMDEKLPISQSGLFVLPNPKQEDDSNTKVGNNEVTVYGVDSTGHPVSVVVSFPNSWKKNKILLSYICYFQSTFFNKKQPPTRITEARAINKFFQYLAQSNYNLADELPNDLFSQYTQFLKAKGGKIGNTVSGLIHISSRPLKSLLDQDFIYEGLPDLVKVRMICANIPDFTKNPTTPVTSLVKIFENCPYSNSDMIESLRLVCCWILETLSSQRIKILENEDIKIKLNEGLKSTGTNEFPLLSYSSSPKYKTHWSREAYGVLARAILDSEDKLLVERLYYCAPNPEKVNSTYEEKIKWMNSWFLEKNRSKLVSNGFKYNKKNYNLGAIKTVTFSSLVRPTDAETFSLQCLLASERIQSSGLYRHKLSDISILEGSFQSSFTKNRGKGNDSKKFPTNRYKRNTLIYRAFSDWILLMESAQEYIEKENKNKTLAYYEREHSPRGVLYNDIPSMWVFDLVSDPTSLYYKRLMLEVGLQGKPFTWLLSRLKEHNHKVSRQNATYDVARGKFKKGLLLELPKRGDFVDLPWLGLAPDFIAKSREQMDDGTEVTLKTDKKVLNPESDEVSAELTGHSDTVKKDVYQNRSDSPEMIQSMRTFSAEVGELMEKEADKIKQSLDKTSVLTLAEAAKILGVEKECNKIEELTDLLAERKIDIGFLGEYEFDGQQVVLVTDLTAALMEGYIEHITKELPRLKLDDEDKALEALIKRAYLIALLEEFPVSIRSKGQKILESHEFPYPSLI